MRPLLAALLIVAASGCREALLTDPPPVAEAPQAPIPSLYIKGLGATLAQGEQVAVWSQTAPSAVRYEWSLTGEGALRTAPGDAPRSLRLTGDDLGVVYLTVVAFDAAGVAVGQGSRMVQVTL